MSCSFPCSFISRGWQGPRPHIFGMTASPLGQKCNSVNACRHFFRQLEDNLNAQVLPRLGSHQPIKQSTTHFQHFAVGVQGSVEFCLSMTPYRLWILNHWKKVMDHVEIRLWRADAPDEADKSDAAVTGSSSAQGC